MRQIRIYQYACFSLLVIGIAILGITYTINPIGVQVTNDFAFHTKFTDSDDNGHDHNIIVKEQTTITTTEAITDETDMVFDYVTNIPEENSEHEEDGKTTERGDVVSSTVINELDNEEDEDKAKHLRNRVISSDKKYDIKENSPRKLVEEILRESIHSHHVKNFVKPANERCKRRLPVCVVIGVAKSGSREIMDFMSLHPNIEIYWHAATYENPYFANKYHKGVEWFKSQMPCTYSNQITVIKNAWYFNNNYIPERIKRFDDNVKLILLLREPVSRAISQFMFFHPRASFSDRTFDDIAVVNNSVNRKADSIKRSIYDEPMKNWLNYFKLDQFLFIESNELKSNPARVLNKVEDFLGLEHYITPDMFVLNKKKGFYCIKSNLTVNGMACYAQDRGRQQPRVQPQTIRKLKEYFKPKNERFFKMIGQSFDWN